ncbi:ABC transporter substrate-binding protein [Methylobacterium sp. PvR107]|uniref:ABC transporter substrate-binding protein n=1 Tax=Methylobacterium sp. PvR107 TaxID=2806597 RepID=UPI001AE938FA|nr:ABC transporter substrate-binding protein [Methylobacterium sp. PvR107]MBP1178064.1 branched-chain amino acid transport system substrate-binding protein [Methylobacterium sp. PvR107]
MALPILNRRHLVAGLGLAPFAIRSVEGAAAQGAEIPLGFVIPFTGATGPYGPDMKKAADLATKTINDAGGILGGRKLKLFIEDEETSATASVTATRKLLEVDRVEMVGGFWGSPPALAAKPLIVGANKVQMVSAAAPAITEGDTKNLVYRFQAKSTQWGPAGAKILKDLGVKKVAVLAQQNPFIVAMVEPFKAEMAKRDGTVTDVVMYNPDQASYRAEVQKAFGPEPEAVFVLALLTDMVAIAKEIYRGGFRSKVLALGTGADADGAFLKSVSPEVAEGIHHLQPAPPLNSISYKKFVKSMGAPDGTVFLFAGNMYDQVCVTALAMEHAKSTEALVWAKSIRAVCNPPGDEADDIAVALERVRLGHDINYIGAGATCDFNDQGDQLNRSFLHQVIEGGKNRIIDVVS